MDQIDKIKQLISIMTDGYIDEIRMGNITIKKSIHIPPEVLEKGQPEVDAMEDEDLFYSTDS